MKWGDYPRPSLAVDVVVLTVAPGERQPWLGLLVIRRTSYEKGLWDIPGAFLVERETAADAVRRTLDDKAGVAHLEPHLLGVFDDPGRDPRGWVVSLAYAAFVPFERLTGVLDSGAAVLASIPSPSEHRQPVRLPDGQAGLPFDHQSMVDAAVRSLRTQYTVGARDPQDLQPDPENLMTHTPFTLTELRQLYETIQGRRIHRDAFARRFDPALNPATQLRPAGWLGTGGRPARAFEKPPTGRA